jgi:hypothetical protein
MARLFPICLNLIGLLAWAGGLAHAQSKVLQQAAQLDAQVLKKHVFTLASEEFAGRRGKGSEKTVDYIVNHFRSNHLKPGFDTSYIQDVIQGTSGKVIGRNVSAKVEGSDPVLSREWIILSAHWDHLGKNEGNGKIYAGADDNASGVAMLLESAAWFARPENRPKRSILFVAFDLEEFGLFGSRYFAAHMPMEEKSLKLFVTADMIGRSLSGICREWVFVIGSERLPESRDWLKLASRGLSIKAGLLGTDLVGVRSDYGPFMTRKVPYLFFSTGECNEYHSANDRPETLDYPKLHQISELICTTVKTAADDARIEPWSDEAMAAPEEMRVIAAVLEEMKSPASGLKLGGYQLNLVEKTLGTIRELLVKNKISDTERKSVIRAAQFLMFTAL